jgi:hypothetical protein
MACDKNYPQYACTDFVPKALGPIEEEHPTAKVLHVWPHDLTAYVRCPWVGKSHGRPGIRQDPRRQANPSRLSEQGALHEELAEAEKGGEGMQLYFASLGSLSFCWPAA